MALQVQHLQAANDQLSAKVTVLPSLQQQHAQLSSAAAQVDDLRAELAILQQQAAQGEELSAQVGSRRRSHLLQAVALTAGWPAVGPVPHCGLGWWVPEFSCMHAAGRAAEGAVRHAGCGQHRGVRAAAAAPAAAAAGRAGRQAARAERRAGPAGAWRHGCEGQRHTWLRVHVAAGSAAPAGLRLHTDARVHARPVQASQLEALRSENGHLSQLAVQVSALRQDNSRLSELVADLPGLQVRAAAARIVLLYCLACLCTTWPALAVGFWLGLTVEGCVQLGEAPTTGHPAGVRPLACLHSAAVAPTRAAARVPLQERQQLLKHAEAGKLQLLAQLEQQAAATQQVEEQLAQLQSRAAMAQQMQDQIAGYNTEAVALERTAQEAADARDRVSRVA